MQALQLEELVSAPMTRESSAAHFLQPQLQHSNGGGGGVCRMQPPEQPSSGSDSGSGVQPVGAGRGGSGVRILPLEAVLRDAVGAMEGAGRWHALALFRAARHHGQEALDIWEGLASGQLQVRLLLWWKCASVERVVMRYS